jgi:hypothetical protein
MPKLALGPITLLIQWISHAPSERVKPHIDQVRKRAAQKLGMLGPLLNRKRDLSITNGVLLYKQIIRPMMPAPMSGSCRCCNPNVFALLLVPPDT